MYIIIMILVILAVMLYRRCFPVYGVPHKAIEGKKKYQKAVILDLRDYNISYKNEVEGSVALPIAYLNRNFGDITSRCVHIIVSDRLERNLGVRILRNKGFRVIGFTILP
ncbi:hypothetical protein [Peribacillus kribbensis]|uniref:hypothetical protein n=1 Tax=Peribacillus kribbensis TaxID=356658 RepID=UPI00040907BA|nr:hypothetical protein [Peribacillus kribbensis]